LANPSKTQAIASVVNTKIIDDPKKKIVSDFNAGVMSVEFKKVMATPTNQNPPITLPNHLMIWASL